MRNWNEAVQIVSMGVNYIRYHGCAGWNDLHRGRGRLFAIGARSAGTRFALANDANSGEDDWPSYNKTLTSNRFSRAESDHRGQRRPSEGSVHL